MDIRNKPITLKVSNEPDRRYEGMTFVSVLVNTFNGVPHYAEYTVEQVENDIYKVIDSPIRHNLFSCGDLILCGEKRFDRFFPSWVVPFIKVIESKGHKTIAFRPNTWEETYYQDDPENCPIRLQLIDMGCVTFPACPDISVDVPPSVDYNKIWEFLASHPEVHHVRKPGEQPILDEPDELAPAPSSIN